MLTNSSPTNAPEIQGRRSPLLRWGVLVFCVASGMTIIIWAVMPSHGRMSLWQAADQGCLEEVKWLIDHGKDVDSIECGETPLMQAAGRGHLEMVQYLVSHGADINAGRDNCGPALVRAICNHHTELAKWLIEYGADVNIKKEVGDTVLHYAARYGNAEIARMLIAKGAVVNVRGEGGRTPLLVTLAFRASRPEKDISVAKVLLEQGADPNISVTTDIAFGINATPLQLAMRFKDPDLEKLLKEHGAK